jgi:hypothetical protein
MKHNFIPTKAGSGSITNAIASISLQAIVLKHRGKGNTCIAIGQHVPVSVWMDNYCPNLQEVG